MSSRGILRPEKTGRWLRTTHPKSPPTPRQRNPLPLSKPQFLHPPTVEGHMQPPGLGPQAQAASPLPWQPWRSRSGSRHTGARPPASPRLSRSSPLIDFNFPFQRGPHRSFPHALGPSSPDSATGSTPRTTLATCVTPGNAHAQWASRACSSDYACLKGGQSLDGTRAQKSVHDWPWSVG
jgi:hypothetical protein